MNRRDFIAALGGAAAWPLVASAQQGDRVRRIGVLMPFEENDPEGKLRYSAFTQALADLGWTDGHNVRMDLRSAGGDNNRIRTLAQELVGLQPDIILAGSFSATVAVERETRTIPIVFATVADPVASGIVPRLDRPSGNITGIASTEASLGGKWLELLSEIAPGLKRVGIRFNPDTAAASPFVPAFEAAAQSLKLEPITAPVHDDGEIETAIIALGREPGSGLFVIPDVRERPSRAGHIGGGPKQRTGGLFGILLCQRRRFTLIWNRPGRQLASRRRLCRSHPARREAGRSAGAVSHKIRDGRKSEDRQGARACRAPIDPAARR
jgi:putative tryptophan/tyrosine transport system substrate-binding protein